MSSTGYGVLVPKVYMLRCPHAITWEYAERIIVTPRIAMVARMAIGTFLLGLLGFIGFIYGILPELGVSLPFSNYLWIPIIVAFTGFVTALIYAGIKPSLKYVFYAIIIEVTFCTVSLVIERELPEMY